MKPKLSNQGNTLLFLRKKYIFKRFVNAIRDVCSYVLNRHACKYDCVKRFVQKAEVNIDKNQDILNYACI